MGFLVLYYCYGVKKSYMQCSSMFGKGIFGRGTGKLNYLRNCFLEGNITLLGIFSVTYSLLQLYEFFFLCGIFGRICHILNNIDSLEQV